MDWQDAPIEPGGMIRYGETQWGGKSGPSRFTEFKSVRGTSRMEGHLTPNEVQAQLKRIRNE